MVELHTDFLGDPPDARDAEIAIERLERRRADAAACVAVLACGVAAAVPIAPELGAPLLAGVVAAAVMAAAAHASLRALLDRCALFPTTSALASVARRHRRLTAPRSRRALAADLRSLAERSDVHVPGRAVLEELVLPDRARRVRGQLVELAALVEQLETPDPIALARLRWLLRDGVGSPLYDPAAPAEQLGVVLHHARLRLTLLEADREGEHEAGRQGG